MTTSDAIAELEAADDAYRDAVDAVEELGEDQLQTVADAHDRFARLLSQYEDTATGSGNFDAFVEFQDRVETLVDRLPDDLPARDAFERAGEVLEQRRLSTADFDQARSALDPAADLAGHLDERTAARNQYRDARRAVVERRRTVNDRIDHLESLRAYADTDLESSVDSLHDPIATYDDAVREAFTDYRNTTAARTVLDFLDATTAYPLVEFQQPPEPLRKYLASDPAGNETIPTLLEYADYSPSKLDYYVDDPREFRRHVGTNRTYLTGIDADPLEVGWPPPTADDLRWLARELIAVVDRFAPDSVVRALHDIRRLTHDPEYDRLRETALAKENLTDEEREQLKSGAVARELDQLREERARLDDVLSRYPTR